MSMMLVNKYVLKDFKKDFNDKLRKATNYKNKFKQLKLELNEHLKNFNADLTVLPNLKIYMENYSLCLSYTEISGQPLVLRFIWKIAELDIEKIHKLNVSFCKEIGAPIYPEITITNEFTKANYGLYYPDEQNILISRHFIEQNKWELIAKVIKHETLHHYCVLKGIPAKDTDEEFIRLLIKYDAFVSLEESAQKAYKQVLSKIIAEKISENIIVDNISQSFQHGA